MSIGLEWWQWLLGGLEFIVAWWCTDRLVRHKGIAPDFVKLALEDLGGSDLQEMERYIDNIQREQRRIQSEIQIARWETHKIQSETYIAHREGRVPPVRWEQAQTVGRPVIIENQAGHVVRRLRPHPR